MTDPARPDRCVAVILAAGGGSRFVGTTHKLLAEIGDSTVIATSVAAPIRAGLTTAVVWGAVDVSGEVPDDVELVHNPDWASGQASSLQCAVRWAATLDAVAVVVGLGDEPWVGAQAWGLVAANDSAPIVIADFEGTRTPPVRLARSVWPLLPNSGDVGAGPLLRAHPELVVAIACDGDPSDIDTVEDLARWI